VSACTGSTAARWGFSAGKGPANHRHLRHEGVEVFDLLAGPINPLTDVTEGSIHTAANGFHEVREPYDERGQERANNCPGEFENNAKGFA
jgi:hypothetical protein